MLQPIAVKAKAETDQNSVRATTSSVGRANQELRDVPQSVTVITEKLMEDRRVDTVKEALHYTAGITFQAAEGGEEDIRLRGFSLTASGDIFIDGVRDTAFYERDVFNFDRIEVLRGSASMLFGRGSTGGVVNQVSKAPLLANISEVSTSIGSGSYLRLTGDFNLKTSETSAFRLNAMMNTADNYGNNVDKIGIAPTFRWGIGTADEFSVGYFYLDNNNGINYGLPWLRQNDSGGISETNPGRADQDRPEELLRRRQRLQRRLRGVRHDPLHAPLPGRRRMAHRAAQRRLRPRPARLDDPLLRPLDQRAGGRHQSGVQPGRPDPGDDLRRDHADPRHQQQGAGPAGDLPADRLHEQVRLVRAARTRSSPASTCRARSSTTTTWSCRPASSSTRTFRGRRSARPTTAPRSTKACGRRCKTRNFVAKALGVYAQDLLEVAPTWKLLAGLRWDKFEGDYVSPPIGTNPEITRSRSDSLWSNRFGVLWQPTEKSSYYASYGTSFNTSGELYNYDAQGSNTPPEKSRNIEIGAKLDLFEGRVSARGAMFHSTKYNERNRDSPDGQPLEHYVLSGERHAAGFELDLAGRITPAWEMFLSYAYIPWAEVDEAGPGGTLTGELPGQRPSMTPRHSGTMFTTYQITPAFRVGGGLNFRSSQTPNRNPPGIVAPSYVTGDLMAEYAFDPQITLKLNVINVTNKLYADSLYTGHYIPGQPRTVYATVTARF